MPCKDCITLAICRATVLDTLKSEYYVSSLSVIMKLLRKCDTITNWIMQYHVMDGYGEFRGKFETVSIDKVAAVRKYMEDL